MPSRWRYAEEVYNFVNDPRDNNATVIVTVGPDSYYDPNLAHNTAHENSTSPSGNPQPIAWYRDGPVNLGTNGPFAVSITHFDHQSLSALLAGTDGLNLTAYNRSDHTASDSGLGKPTVASGRMFYTGLGHSNETWHDPDFIDHIYGGLGWVLNIDTTK
jgi:hypothetical protein